MAAPDGCWVRELHLGGARERRDRVRTLAANHGFDMVRRWLTGLEIERVD